MKAFAFQMQFPAAMSPALREDAMLRVFRMVQAGSRTGRVEEGAKSDGLHVTITARVENAVAFWDVVRSQPDFPPARMIVVCEGSLGWDDYLLLHHFDPQQALDQLGNP